MIWMKWTSAACAILLAIGATSADAHSKKNAIQPADGAVLEASPSAITITFDMPLRVTLITMAQNMNWSEVITCSPSAHSAHRLLYCQRGSTWSNGEGWLPTVIRCRVPLVLKSRSRSLC